MAAILDEHAQYVDASGRPLTGGSLYIGDVDADPILNPKPIFSDREMTTALANPQTLDANGRSANKIWTEGNYSLQINDINGVQVFQDLDRGESLSTQDQATWNAGTNTTLSLISPSTLSATFDHKISGKTQDQADWDAGTDITPSLIDPETLGNVVRSRSAPDFIVENQQANGVGGGGLSSSGWNTLFLNAEVRDNDGVLSLSANEITVTADCYIEWAFPIYSVNEAVTRLYDVTAAAVASANSAAGMNVFPRDAGANVMSLATGWGFLEVGTTYRFECDSKVGRSSVGQGFPISNGNIERYGIVKGWLT